MTPAPDLLIGVGNDQRGDDGAGLALVEILEGRAGLATARCRGDLTQLFDLWQGHDWVLVADMIEVADGVAGEVQRLDVTTRPLPYAVSCSSHGLSLAEAIEMARALECLPARLEVLGIVGTDTSLGAPVSDAVAQTVDALATRLLTEYPGWSVAHA
jgi:hydrogenase maturation protease